MLVEPLVLLLVAAFFSVLFGLLTLLLRKRYPDYISHALTSWGSSHLCFGAMFLLMLPGPSRPFFFNVISGTFALVGLSLELRAIAELKHQRSSRTLIFALSIAPPAVALMQGVWFTFIQRNIPVLVTVSYLLETTLTLACSFSFLRPENGTRRLVDSIAGVIYLMLGGATALAASNAILHNGTLSQFNLGVPAVTYNAVVTIVAESLMFSLFMLSMTERLNHDFEYRATHDLLTDLWNRKAFEQLGFDRISGASRADEPSSVLMVDIDNFKQLNSLYGRAIGDFILKSMADALRETVRKQDHLCRWGGDEFCALLPATTRSEAEALAERALAAMASVEIVVEGHPIKVEASIGVASGDGDRLEFALLLNWADVALVRAKELGRNRFAFA